MLGRDLSLWKGQEEKDPAGPAPSPANKLRLEANSSHTSVPYTGTALSTRPAPGGNKTTWREKRRRWPFWSLLM